MILADKFDEEVVHLPRVRSTEEVLPIFHGLQLRVWRVNEELDLLFSIGDRVHCVGSALGYRSHCQCPPSSNKVDQDTYVQPHDRTPYVKQP